MLEHLKNFALEHTTAMIVLGSFSVLTFIATLIIVPLIVINLPADYFAHHKRHGRETAKQHPLLRLFFIFGKNFLGVLFFISGILMLILPGQGILTILISITLLDFPGKYRFESWLVSRQPVLKSINWLRQRKKRPPLIIR